MYCPECGFKNTDDSPSCTSCGESLEIIEKTEINLKCPSCGGEYTGKGIFSKGVNLVHCEFKFIPKDSDAVNVCSTCGYILRLE